MASFFQLRLDTTAPQSPSIVIEGGAAAVPQQLVNLTIGTTDVDTTSYMMKIWGDVDGTNDTNVQSTEATSTWITYNTAYQIKLSATDGTKTVYLKIRDDVGNVSAQASDSVTLDMTVPIVLIMSGPTPNKISKIPTWDVSTFQFQADSEFYEYKVMVVPTSGSDHSTGVVIGTAAGSTNMAGTATEASPYAANTNITCTINGTDLETASPSDGLKYIKVFVKDQAGNWSA